MNSYRTGKTSALFANIIEIEPLLKKIYFKSGFVRYFIIRITDSRRITYIKNCAFIYLFYLINADKYNAISL